MAALFSCTKCHTRHPFDDLSRGEQLCKDCRSKFPVVKCTYCREEFQQGNRGTSSICKKCAENVRNYGKPSACEYCSILAAFIGGRCQRCANSERKWGCPKTCEQCKQKCAFDRGDQKKDDGKLLCWLCTLAYRRVVAKTRKQRDDTRKSLGTSHKKPSSKSSSPQKSASEAKLDKIFGPSKTENVKTSSNVDNLLKFSGVGQPVKKSLLDKTKQSSPAGSRDSAESLSEKAASLLEKTKEKPNKSKPRSSLISDDDVSASKKQKFEKSSSNGVTTPKSNSNSSFTDTSKLDSSVSSDHVIVITQLKDQIESFKRQLQVKDNLIKEKDKKISELKVSEYELEKVLRGKLQSLNHTTSISIDTLQVKNKELMRQVATLSKQKDKKGTSSAVPSPAPNTLEL